MFLTVTLLKFASVNYLIIKWDIKYLSEVLQCSEKSIKLDAMSSLSV